MSTKAPRYLTWTEPPAVGRRYYPSTRAGEWIGRILGILTMFGVLLLVLLVDHPDPNAKWVLLAIGLIGAACFAFGLPALLRRSGAIVAINAGGVSRASTAMSIVPLLAFWAVVRGQGSWYWLNIGKLELALESFDGQAIRVLRVYGRDGQLLGCAGVADKVPTDGIAAWVQYKNKVLEVQSALPQ
jgi:hypothetical protein